MCGFMPFEHEHSDSVSQECYGANCGVRGPKADTREKSIAAWNILMGLDSTQVAVPRDPTPEMLRLISPMAQRLKIDPISFMEFYDVILKSAELELIR